MIRENRLLEGKIFGLKVFKRFKIILFKLYLDPDLNK